MADAENRRSIARYVEDDEAAFREKPLDAVDALVFSELAYFKWNCVPAIFKDSPEPAERTLKALCREEHRELLLDVQRSRDLKLHLMEALAESRRFGGVGVVDHADHLDDVAVKQFSATTFALPDGSVFVAFRGTDSTLTGWREDFMIGFTDEVPAQAAARDYLDRIASVTSGPIYAGGHSKGGNLAVYAAATCGADAFLRLAGVYDFDGPGFSAQAFDRAGVERTSLLVERFVPVDSVVGMLLQSLPGAKVVRSTASGFDQHDPFSWIVIDGDFSYAEGTSEFSRFMGDTMSGWIAGLDREQLAAFTDTLFGMFDAAGGLKLVDLAPEELAARANYLGSIDPSMRAMFTETVRQLARSARASFDPLAAIGEFLEEELLPPDLTPRERFIGLADKLDALDDKFK